MQGTDVMMTPLTGDFVLLRSGPLQLLLPQTDIGAAGHLARPPLPGSQPGLFEIDAEHEGEEGFVIALSLLVLLSPALLLIAIGVKLASPGSVLFRQVRCGLHGRRFTFLKFRTMRTDAERLKPLLEPFNEMDGPAFKMTNDPRVFPFGGFLRRTSLDELPQLINILRGDMSFVGPRPSVVEEVNQYEPWQRRRLSVRPGITGMWQVSGRNTNVGFEEWMQLDLKYIDTWSLWLDIKILFKTVPVVLLHKGAS